MPPFVRHAWDAELGYSRVSLAARPPGGPVDTPPNVAGADPVWGVWTTDPDGHGTLVHIFPHATFEWRAAEYALDPDDVPTLLDVILHEGAIPDPGHPVASNNPAALQFLRDTHGWPTCWTPGVPDEDRRQAYLERIRMVKDRFLRHEAAPRKDRQGALVYVGSKRVAPADPLEPILSQTRIDPIRVAGKRGYVEWARATQDGPLPSSYSLKPPATFAGGRELGGHDVPLGSA
ncbi:hypothetical protein [Microbispora sp. CA-102843]|uniref:hypothetical protein n=1 Tax=Microbispora sp. CA-102843 TaxID=3239952 RepID=UPI003D8F1C59